MCQFCVQHGEGKRWYLNAQNYSFDLQSDMRRRDYVVSFIQGFGEARENAISWMERLSCMPPLIGKAGKSALSHHMRRHHFGQPVPLEECQQILELATSITVIPCICRMHAPGKNADEVCVLVTTQPIKPVLEQGFSGYEQGPALGDFHTMSIDEAMRLLNRCEEQGLMHSVWTFQTPFAAAICNCNLESGCMAMKLTAGYEMKLMWRGESVVQLDERACVGCGACVGQCPFDAIEMRDKQVSPHAEQCWGCGICRAVCSQDALSLVDRRSVPEVATLW